MIEVREYLDDLGFSPFGQWYPELRDAVVAAKIATALYRISKGNFGDMKAVGAGVFERRVDFGTGYRIYFAQDGDELVVLLVGGTKKRQSADIAEAKRRWGHYKRRKQTEG